jgi:hypothetical protein
MGVVSIGASRSRPSCIANQCTQWLCSRLLAAYGVPIARCEVKTFGATKALVVERFDRVLHSSQQYWL